MTFQETSTTSYVLHEFLLLGDQAGKNGLLEESLKWYTQGFTKAKELKDEIMERLFSGLIMLSL